MYRPYVSLASSSITAIALLLVTATVVLAADCYGANNEGAAVWDGYYSRQGIKGEMDHFSATPVSGYAIAHPTQIASAIGSDFVGWGTYKGVAPSPTDCEDNYTSSWRVYIDGYSFGAYFCKSPYGTGVANNAQNQQFLVHYSTCPGDGGQKWVFYWNGAWKTCKTINYHQGSPSAGSESASPHANPPNQTLTVRYEAVRTSYSGSWIDFGQRNKCEDQYVVQVHGARSWTVDP